MKEGNVPLNGGVEVGVMNRCGAAQGTVSDREIKPRVLGHAAQQRGHVLNGMTANGEDAITRISQNAPQERRTLYGSVWRKCAWAKTLL